jgi:hypothetical protein
VHRSSSTTIQWFYDIFKISYWYLNTLNNHCHLLVWITKLSGFQDKQMLFRNYLMQRREGRRLLWWFVRTWEVEYISVTEWRERVKNLLKSIICGWPQRGSNII